MRAHGLLFSRHDLFLIDRRGLVNVRLLLDQRLAGGRDERRTELVHGLIEGSLGVGGEFLGLANGLEDIGVVVDVVQQSLLERKDVLQVEVVELAVGAGPYGCLLYTSPSPRDS